MDCARQSHIPDIPILGLHRPRLAVHQRSVGVLPRSRASAWRGRRKFHRDLGSLGSLGSGILKCVFPWLTYPYGWYTNMTLLNIPWSILDQYDIPMVDISRWSTCQASTLCQIAAAHVENGVFVAVACWSRLLLWHLGEVQGWLGWLGTYWMWMQKQFFNFCELNEQSRFMGARYIGPWPKSMLEGQDSIAPSNVHASLARKRLCG